MSAYDTCATSPTFPKEGHGWFVLFIGLTLFTFLRQMECQAPVLPCRGKYSQDFILPA